jgi:hypothetical protein
MRLVPNSRDTLVGQPHLVGFFPVPLQGRAAHGVGVFPGMDGTDLGVQSPWDSRPSLAGYLIGRVRCC